MADEAALELDPEVILKRMTPQLSGNLPFGPAPLPALDRVADQLPDRSRLLLTRKGVEGSGLNDNVGLSRRAHAIAIAAALRRGAGDHAAAAAPPK